MANILSIDWDAFFVGSGSISEACGACSWSCSDATCTASRRPQVIPKPHSMAWHPYNTVYPYSDLCNGALAKLIASFKIEDASLYIAECHADIWQIIQNFEFILNIDAHEDYGALTTRGKYHHRRGSSFEHWVHCGNWAGLAARLLYCDYEWACANENYSKIKLYGVPRGARNRHYRKVFICQSRPWTPAGYDQHFYEFVRTVKKRTRSITFLGPHANRLKHHILS